MVPVRCEQSKYRAECHWHTCTRGHNTPHPDSATVKCQWQHASISEYSSAQAWRSLSSILYLSSRPECRPEPPKPSRARVSHTTQRTFYSIRARLTSHCNSSISTLLIGSGSFKALRRISNPVPIFQTRFHYELRTSTC
jgi:hypothetical protein